ncbi:hypothetical protein [Pelagibius sp.]|uniref:hypothetical protein n=1 Tax=Pelagibius sp. TaxID=1931238 RepID=UPI003B50664E
MAAVGIAFLYLAWFLSWFGTFATTCTGSDPKSLAGGLVLSVGPYLVSFACLRFARINPLGLIVALPLMLLLVRQAYWGAQLFIVVTVNGRSACSHMFGEEFGPSQGGWLEQVYAPYYLFVSLGAIAALGYAHWCHWQERQSTA